MTKGLNFLVMSGKKCHNISMLSQICLVIAPSAYLLVKIWRREVPEMLRFFYVLTGDGGSLVMTDFVPVMLKKRVMKSRGCGGFDMIRSCFGDGGVSA
jgi:hypothetical protein